MGICLGVKRLDRLTKDLLSLAAVSAVVFYGPWIAARTAEGFSYSFLFPIFHAGNVLFGYPIFCLVAGMLCSGRHGFSWLRALLPALVSLRSWEMFPLYALAGLLGAWIGGRGRKKGP